MSRRASAVRSQLLLDFSETDLNKLQQQYRRAERAKRALTEKTERVINRGREEIQKLQDEREGLLWILQCRFNHLTDASVIQDCTAMLACKDRIDEELQAEKAKAGSLKEEILKWERMLAGQGTGGETTHRVIESDESNLLNNIGWAENKLYRTDLRSRRSYGGEAGAAGAVYLSIYHKLMHRNGELREELMVLQVEKKQFLRVQSHLEKELRAIRKDICNLMTKCTEATSTSVKIHEKQQMLRDQNAKDVAQYIKEWGNLGREISRYCYFESFLGMKAIARNNQDSDHRNVEKCDQLQSKELELEDFEDAIKQILRETEENDVDTLNRNFIQMEGQSYTLLNFVSCQLNEAEVIRRQISQLYSEREIFLAEEQQQQEQLQALRMRVAIKQEATEQQLAVYQQRVEFMENLLDQFKAGLESLLQITYDNSVICDQSGSSDRVLDKNLKEYLRMVEDRLNELLTLQSFLHFQEKSSQWDIDSLSTIAGQLIGITPPAASLTTAAATPAPDDEPDLVESVLLEAKEPMSREDLLTLVNKRSDKIESRFTIIHPSDSEEKDRLT
ncbi:outer dynein arm-docking complex subunit 1-like [Chelmon rostratus]|uniref:outer dynein arm-docking complex subunit 1-like n=1 Tax=Chelmon rostratus TaxID=109905 RepID=UPI001BE7D3AA|nr:outer dynein arm-docking complex subunit 1-like [Chelmon rostratus]